jgi:hypothetical protein
MKKITVGRGLIVAVCLFVVPGLSGCNTTAPASVPATQPSIPPGTKLDPGLAVFRDVCLGSAPSFAAGVAVAKKYGVEVVGGLGMSEDHSLGVQIKPGKECAVTTEARPGSVVRTQFLQIVSAAAAAPIDQNTSIPFAARVGGQNSIFHHDRKGGEAYVIIPKS